MRRLALRIGLSNAVVVLLFNLAGIVGSRLRSTYSPPPTPPLDWQRYVPSQIAGLGRYNGGPAFFLEQKRGGHVLPIPIRGVKASEQLVSGKRPASGDVRAQANLVRNFEGGLFDNLPWEWNPSVLAKRDAALAISSGTYPKEGYDSGYHLLLALMRRDACAKPTAAIIEDTSIFDESVVLGGCLFLQRTDGYDSVLCECYPEEAIGVASALGASIQIEKKVWEAAAVQPAYSLQDNKMRLNVEVPVGAAKSEDVMKEYAAPLPWEISSTSELESMTLQQKALSALKAGLKLPRARTASDEAILSLLLPSLDESVRRKLQVKRAANAEDYASAIALERSSSKRYKLKKEMRQAVNKDDYGKAFELNKELRVETDRRWDITQDEGAYDTYLDQDYWYAEMLAKQREAAWRKEAEDK